MSDLAEISRRFNIPEHMAQAAQKAIAILDSLKITYSIIGGTAVSLHSRPRSSQDVDFLVPFSDLDKLKNYFKSYTSLALPNRFGISVMIDEVDIDFIAANEGEEFLFKDLRTELGLKFPNRNELLYLKLDSDRTRDMTDAIQLCKQMDLGARTGFQKFITSLPLEPEVKDKLLQDFTEHCQIADLELNNDKRAGIEYRKFVLKKLI